MHRVLLASTALSLAYVVRPAFAQDYDPNINLTCSDVGCYYISDPSNPDGGADARDLNGGGSTLALNEYYRTLLHPANPYGYGLNAETNDRQPVEVFYPPSESGAAQSAFLIQNLQLDTANPADAGKPVEFGASDAFFSAPQISSWAGSTGNINGGALIQLPAFGTSIVIANRFAQVGPVGKKKAYTKTLVITDADLCQIFSGGYSDLSQIYHAAATNATLSGAFNVVYDPSPSGTAFLTTQHLQKVCPVPTNGITFTATKQFSDLFKTVVASQGLSIVGGVIPAAFMPTYYGVTGFFIPASGSPGIASAMLGVFGGNTYKTKAISGGTTVTTTVTFAIDIPTGNAIGYLAPDYTSVATKSVPNSFISGGSYVANTLSPFLSLKASSLINAHNGKTYTPSTANTTLGLSAPNFAATPPDTTTVVPPSLANARNPAYWVPQIGDPLNGYPIVGYTTLDFAQCYATSPTSKGLVVLDWMKQLYNVTNRGNLNEEGFVKLPTTPASLNLNSAVIATFITNTYGFGVNINNPAACAPYPGLQ